MPLWGFVLLLLLPVLSHTLVLAGDNIKGSSTDGCSAAAPTRDPRDRPNVLFLLVDDMGFGDVGCFGNHSIMTPHIDALCGNGRKLSQFIVAEAICTPSRAAFLTGRYPVRSGMASSHPNFRTLNSPAQPGGLPRSETTIAEALQGAGYRTAMVGKWHLGVNGDPYRQGLLSTDDNSPVQEQNASDLAGYHLPTHHGFQSFFGLPVTNVQSCSDEKTVYYHSSKVRFYAERLLVPLLSSLAVIVVSAVVLRLRFSVQCGLCLLLALGAFAGYYGTIHYTLITPRSCLLYRGDLLVEQPVRLAGLTQRFVEEALEFIVDKASVADVQDPTALASDAVVRAAAAAAAATSSIVGIRHGLGVDDSAQPLPDATRSEVARLLASSFHAEQGLRGAVSSPGKDTPFFLFMSFAKMHTALFTHESFRNISGQDAWRDNLLELDWAVGALMAALRALCLERHTLVVFTSDNGPYLERGVEGGSSGVLRGHDGQLHRLRGGKGQNWEGGVRVPAIASWPGTIPAGESTQLFSAMDLLPTIARLAKANLPGDRTVDGVDQSDLLLHPPVQPEIPPDNEPNTFGNAQSQAALTAMKTERFLVHYCGTEVSAMRQGRFKLHLKSPRYETDEDTHGICADCCPRNVICGCDGIDYDPPLLIDLATDPSERNAVSSSSALYQAVAPALLAGLEAHKGTLREPVPNQLEHLFRPWLMPCGVDESSDSAATGLGYTHKCLTCVECSNEQRAAHQGVWNNFFDHYTFS